MKHPSFRHWLPLILTGAAALLLGLVLLATAADSAGGQAKLDSGTDNTSFSLEPLHDALLWHSAVFVYEDAVYRQAEAFTAWQARVEAERQAKIAADRAKNEMAASRPAVGSSNPVGGSVWDRLAQCESGGRWSYNGSSGYDGGLQFHPGTWSAYGGNAYAPYAWQASRPQQIAVAEKVLVGQGWGAWPACSRKLGLR